MDLYRAGNSCIVDFKINAWFLSFKSTNWFNLYLILIIILKWPTVNIKTELSEIWVSSWDNRYFQSESYHL